MLGILAIGSNHFIVEGPLPDCDTAIVLAQHWSIIQIGRTTPVSLRRWSIVTRAFREDLAWAVVVPGDGDRTPAVEQLLAEVAARGIAIHNSAFDDW